MLNIVPGYIFRYLRKKQNLAIKTVANELEIDRNYLCNMENAKVDIPEHMMKTLINYYHINEEKSYTPFLNEKMIEFYFKKLISSTFDQEDLYKLEQLKNKYNDNFYRIYLDLIIFCYRAFKQKYNQNMEEMIKEIEKNISLMPKYYQYVFYIYVCNYEIREKEINQFHKYRKLLEGYSFSSFQAIILYTDILYHIYLNEYFMIPTDIEECKKRLAQEPNEMLENALTYIQGNFYRNIHNNKQAILMYTRYSDVCKQQNNLDGYAIGQNGIGWIYSLQKNYLEAISHYQKAYPYMQYADFYFDYAWCCYNVGDKEKALQLINQGKQSANLTVRWQLYLEWLEYMISNPYGKRCYQKLEKLYNEYFEELSLEMKNFLLIALINYHSYHQELNEVNRYTKQLIDLNIISNISLQL